MTTLKPTQFFRCFSINLHNFFKSTGLRHMSKEEHTRGINILSEEDGAWKSYSSLTDAAADTKFTLEELEEIHEKLLSVDGAPIYQKENDYFQKRVRVYWVYKVDDKLERALKTWRETGPRADS